MTIGVVCGKFYPLHTGHLFLLEQALRNADETYGILCKNPGEDPDWIIRLKWLHEAAPQINWTTVYNDPEREDDSEWWAERTLQALKEDFGIQFPKVDVVTTSESYGNTWAAALGARHEEVDNDRTIFNVSGTLCREDPWNCWQYLSRPAKQYYAKRVCIVGGESVGKTTIAEQLAQVFKTLWVPEVGRFHTQAWGTDPEDESIWRTIISDQLAFENHLARQCNGLLISDTDLMTTQVWYRNWVGREDEVYHKLQFIQMISRDQRYNKLPYDLYVVLSHNVPWINDGSRSEYEKREWYTEQLLHGVQESGVPYVVVDQDNYHDRAVTAYRAVKEKVLGYEGAVNGNR